MSAVLNSPSPSVRADAAIAELRRQHAEGLKAVDVFWPSSEQKAALANVRELKARIDTWSDARRVWAEHGRRDDGSSYTWDRWFAEGKDYADAIRTHTQASYDGGFFTGVVAPTVKQTASDVKDVAKEAAAIAVNWTPIVIGVVALVAVAVALTQAKSLIRG